MNAIDHLRTANPSADPDEITRFVGDLQARSLLVVPPGEPAPAGCEALSSGDVVRLTNPVVWSRPPRLPVALSWSGAKLYQVPCGSVRGTSPDAPPTDLSAVGADVVGEGVAILTPYGTRRVTYADHAASGRAYGPIEDTIRTNVLPLYANVHSETSLTGAQTIAFREEAREIIKRATKCSDDDVCIFTGSGMTGAIHTLITCLGLAVPCTSITQAVFTAIGGRPVVLVGAYEHHSNLLPWYEAFVDVVTIAECDVDGIDLDDLKAQLAQHAGKRLIGCFSAGSNVTGRLTNIAAVAKCVHDAGGVVFFDYAAAGPYVDLDMACCDAIFLSMHKFVGGPGAPGVLLAKKSLFENAVPHAPGGGTVSFVTSDRHTYSSDIEHREEGGTPNIVGSIRAGLAMQLKENVGAATILAHEQAAAARCIDAFRQEPGVSVLGDLDAARLGIVSFVVTYKDKCLHHNFVVALLNDLFGIQARGGNSCAAPYASRLLKVSPSDEDALEACVADGWHGCKPGWTRISFGWYDSDDTIALVINAARFIARFGVCFLPDYTFDPKSGSWTNLAGRPTLMSLATPSTSLPMLPESAREAYLDEAFALASAPHPPAATAPTPFEALRWFWLPGEV